jgi:hypothetical protein
MIGAEETGARGDHQQLRRHSSPPMLAGSAAARLRIELSASPPGHLRPPKSPTGALLGSWPLAAIVQGTRTPPSHGGNRGSNPRSGIANCVVLPRRVGVIGGLPGPDGLLPLQGDDTERRVERGEIVRIPGEYGVIARTRADHDRGVDDVGGPSTAAKDSRSPCVQIV